MTAPPTDGGLDRPATSDTTARALVAAIPDPIFRIGTDGIYRGFKVDSEEDLMTPAEEVIGRSVHERLPPHVAEAILEAGRRAVAEQEVQRIEYSMQIRAEERDYEGRVVACGPDEFVLIVRDFTERTLQERVLQRERDFSRAVVRSTPSFLALVDENGTLLGVNRALERAAGIPEEAWLGHPFWKLFIAEEDVPRAREDFVRMRDGEPPGTVEYEHVGPEGERLVVDWTATIVHDAEGALRYLLCGLDVTARKQAEEEIRRSRARIVSAGDAERKRLERNLHDGAQQNLVTVTHSIHLAARSLHTDPGKAEEHLERALVELTTAHEELRELGRGWRLRRAGAGRARDRGDRRRRRRRGAGGGLGSRWPPRPRRGARRHVRGAQPARRGYADPRRAAPRHGVLRGLAPQVPDPSARLRREHARRHAMRHWGQAPSGCQSPNRLTGPMRRARILPVEPRSSSESRGSAFL